jgi:hypothetical protein
MIELVRACRTPEELAKEFEPSAQAIRNWVAQVSCALDRIAAHGHAIFCRLRAVPRTRMKPKKGRKDPPPAGTCTDFNQSKSRTGCQSRQIKHVCRTRAGRGIDAAESHHLLRPTPTRMEGFNEAAASMPRRGSQTYQWKDTARSTQEIASYVERLYPATFPFHIHRPTIRGAQKE